MTIQTQSDGKGLVQISSKHIDEIMLQNKTLWEENEKLKIENNFFKGYVQGLIDNHMGQARPIWELMKIIDGTFVPEKKEGDFYESKEVEF